VKTNLSPFARPPVYDRYLRTPDKSTEWRRHAGDRRRLTSLEQSTNIGYGAARRKIWTGDQLARPDERFSYGCLWRGGSVAACGGYLPDLEHKRPARLAARNGEAAAR
jgi:hypothetical protein